MSYISPSILRGLSSLVPEQLNFVCLVELNKSKWFLGLGRKQFYFISEDLTKYKDPPIPYKMIEACRLCKKRKTLMQLKLFVNNPNMAESKALTKELIETYGEGGTLDIYNQDRKAAVDSFRCYWQIDNMIQTREFREFRIVDVDEIFVEPPKDDDEQQVEGIDLKQRFKLPGLFVHP